MNDWQKFPDWQGCKHYAKRLPDNSELMVLVGREPRNGGENVWHLSISCRYAQLSNLQGGALKKRIPTFEEIKEARYRFIPDEVNMGMLFPPKKYWVTLPDSVVIHLWEVPLECADLSEAVK